MVIIEWGGQLWILGSSFTLTDSRMAVQFQTRSEWTFSSPDSKSSMPLVMHHDPPLPHSSRRMRSVHAELTPVRDTFYRHWMQGT